MQQEQLEIQNDFSIRSDERGTWLEKETWQGGKFDRIFAIKYFMKCWILYQKMFGCLKNRSINGNEDQTWTITCSD